MESDGASSDGGGLASEVLHLALDDWVAVGWIVPMARRLGAPDYAAALERSIGTARSLHDQGLVRFGSIDEDGWHYFEGPAGAALDQLRQFFADSGPDFADYFLWLELTPKGVALARSREPAYQAAVEADAHRTSAST